MENINACWRKIIDFLQVPSQPGLFVLGSFAKRVSIYSQQVRAINLVDALAGLGYLEPASRVAVVGAGFAGMTASAALAKLGIPVTLYDARKAAMHLQLSCNTRYIHPHIHDWPLTDIDAIDAGLPVMDWRAGRASDVARRLQEDWDGRYRNKVATRLGLKVNKISPSQQQWQVSTVGCAEAETYDLVILSVGFGVESEGPFSAPYWHDLPIDAITVQEKNWLVSGSGDGALTDVIRLCVEHTGQEIALLEVVKSISRLDAGWLQDLRAKVRENLAGVALFDGLDANIVAQALKLRVTMVTMNASLDEVFGSDRRPPRSSVLNRLIAWLMWKNGRLHFAEGRLDVDALRRQKARNGEYRVTPAGTGSAIYCQEILLRHGPVSVIQAGPPRAAAAAREATTLEIGCPPGDLDALREKWDALYASRQGDPTLVADWPAGMLAPPRIAPDFNRYPGMLLYSLEKYPGLSNLDATLAACNAIFQSGGIPQYLSGVLQRPFSIGGNIATLAFEDAVSTPRMLSHAVQALCRAPVLIVDGGNVSAALAMLLGIRAAVRRGVTLIYRQGPINREVWQTMPFNLREARIVEVADDSSQSGFERPLAEAMEEGLRRLGTHGGNYSDLPGFDTLRRFGGHGTDAAPKAGVAEILVLCPYGKEYTRDCWPQLQRGAKHHFPKSATDEGPARRVIDLAAPEMLARRLYEAIRRNKVCVADLTGHRPDVYFELGVRLACSPEGAHTIFCGESRFAVADPVADALRELLGSKSYLVIHGTVDALKSIAASGPRDELNAGFVFDIVERNIDTAQEAGGVDVLDLLWSSITAVGDTNLRKSADLHGMYKGNVKIKGNSLRFIADGLCAYVLLAKHSVPAEGQLVRFTNAVEYLHDLNKGSNFPAATQSKINAVLAAIGRS